MQTPQFSPPQLPPGVPPSVAPPLPGRPYRLQPWAVEALRELLDVMVHISEGNLSGPREVSERLASSARSLETVLTVNDINEAQLIDALLMQSYAFLMTTRELARLTGRLQPELTIGYQFAAWEQAQSLGADVNRDTLNSALYMLRQVQRQP